MKKSIIGLVSLASVIAVYAGDPPRSESNNARISRTESALVTITATVESIDLAKREVTLKGPLGNGATFIVDKRIKRLDEVQVGDVVQADYYVSIAADLREPTPEEEKNPITILEDSPRAPATQSPAGAEAHRVKVVTTIEGLDRPTRTITIKGPHGNYLTARVEKPENLEKMRIGENIVVTYTEAVAISLEKVKKTKTE